MTQIMPNMWMLMMLMTMAMYKMSMMKNHYVNLMKKKMNFKIKYFKW